MHNKGGKPDVILHKHLQFIMKRHTIAILMATYNGERFLREQIDSIMAQSVGGWHLYVHDDGSRDSTTAILAEYETAHPDTITLLDYPSQGGACKNFFSMMKRVEADYYMFADQDDYWHPDKIEQSVQAMNTLEKEHGLKPIVVHSDLRVVDERLQEINPSFFALMGIRPERLVSFNDYALQDVATGCTMLFNRAARDAALGGNIDKALMHDAWVTLRTVAGHGVRHCINKPLIDYRQHSDNVLGAGDVSKYTLAFRLRNLRDFIHRNWMHFRMMQAAGGMTFMEYAVAKVKSLKGRSQTAADLHANAAQE
jgi:glycosyltransferase involved in cell wall biosynthesis